MTISLFFTQSEMRNRMVVCSPYYEVGWLQTIIANAYNGCTTKKVFIESLAGGVRSDLGQSSAQVRLQENS